MPSEKIRSNCSDAWKRSPNETVTPLSAKRLSTLDLLLHDYASDTYAYDLITISTDGSYEYQC